MPGLNTVIGMIEQHDESRRQGNTLALAPAAPYVSWSYDKGVPEAGMPWSPDGPVFVAFHDRDVAMDKNSVERLLSQLGQGVRYITADEYCAYLHTRIQAAEAKRRA
jgi:hypothetical protein